MVFLFPFCPGTGYGTLRNVSLFSRDFMKSVGFSSCVFFAMSLVSSDCLVSNKCRS
jgi:hypothetical protein